MADSLGRPPIEGFRPLGSRGLGSGKLKDQALVIGEHEIGRIFEKSDRVFSRFVAAMLRPLIGPSRPVVVEFGSPKGWVGSLMHWVEPPWPIGASIWPINRVRVWSKVRDIEASNGSYF